MQYTQQANSGLKTYYREKAVQRKVWLNEFYGNNVIKVVQVGECYILQNIALDSYILSMPELPEILVREWLNIVNPNSNSAYIDVLV